MHVLLDAYGFPIRFLASSMDSIRILIAFLWSLLVSYDVRFGCSVRPAGRFGSAVQPVEFG